MFENYPNYPEHNTDSDDCWCEPEVLEFDNGSKVIIHRGDN